MSGRENTEAELMYEGLKKMVYSGTGYAYNSGGKMADIATLSNTEIKDYHRRFYYPANTTVIMSGMLDPAKVLPLIATVDLSPKVSEAERALPWKVVEVAPFSQHHSSLVDFPSDDNEVGSVSFAWRGPRVDDLETGVALEALFLFLGDSSASPFSQRFVEHEPVASYVDLQYKPYIKSSIIINFEGVNIPGEASFSYFFSSFSFFLSFTTSPFWH